MLVDDVVVRGSTAAAAPSSTAAAGGAYGSAGSSSAAGAASAGGTDAAVASTSLGQVVVDGTGMTAYYFDTDVAGSGSSSCTGACAALWPAIESATTTPMVTGITGTVATIKAIDGGNQITIDGRPIYTFAKDTAPGDVNGQGVGGVWYVISPAGAELKTAN